MKYQDWYDAKKFTMHYEVICEFPNGDTLQYKGKREVISEREADWLIEEWNRLAQITKNIKYSYRRLS